MILLILAGTISTLSAQTEKKQFISLSYYPATLYYWKHFGSIHYFNQQDRYFSEYEAIFGDYGYKAVGYDIEYHGALEMAYKRYVSESVRFNLGLSCELNSKHWDIYDVADGPRTKRVMDYRVYLLPGIDYLCREWGKAKMYLSAQAGMGWTHRGLEFFEKDQRNRYAFAWQLGCSFEYSIVEPLNLNWGLGYGTLGILKLGAAYIF